MRFLPFTCVALVVAFFATSTHSADPRKREPADEAVDRGLRYLARQQELDGGWASGGLNLRPVFPRPGLLVEERPRGNSDLAVTALCVMAFLSAGHVPGEGPYGEVINRGVRFVMNGQQRENGLFAAPFAGQMEMYYHGICTLMLAEVAGMTSGKTAEELKKRLQAAVAVMLKAQRIQGREVGGWRYQIIGQDADLSVTGWQLMALRAAKNLGCDIPHDRIKAAVEYVKKLHDARTGGFNYTSFGNPTIPCTGVGILSLELAGKEQSGSDEAKRAGSYLLKNPLSPNNSHFFYGVYYTSQGMFQLGEGYWKSYREQLHKLLLNSNPPGADGAWNGRGGIDDGRLGANYCTAMAVLSLTVEYRYLPIYQRFEEPKERDGKD